MDPITQPQVCTMPRAVKVLLGVFITIVSIGGLYGAFLLAQAVSFTAFHYRIPSPFTSSKITVAATTSAEMPNSGGNDAAAQSAQQALLAGTPKFIRGAVSVVHSSSLAVTTDQGTIAVSITPDTKVVRPGAMKDTGAFNKEQALFNAQLTVLQKDPAANKEALARIVTPTPFIETPAVFSDIKNGDMVVVACDGTSPAGACDALEVVKM